MRIIITDDGYVANLPKLERPVRIRQVFDLASDHGWIISLPNQHWDK